MSALSVQKRSPQYRRYRVLHLYYTTVFVPGIQKTRIQARVPQRTLVQGYNFALHSGEDKSHTLVPGTRKKEMTDEFKLPVGGYPGMRIAVETGPGHWYLHRAAYQGQ
jgi:hypothetical protein